MPNLTAAPQVIEGVRNLRDKVMTLLGQDSHPLDQLAAIQDEGRRLRVSAHDGSDEAEWLDTLPALLSVLGLKADTPPTSPTPWIYRGEMPGPIPYFEGRTAEKAILEKWAADPNSRIFQIWGAGGYGKTQLVNHWLADLGSEADTGHRRFTAIFCWCFYTLTARVPLLFNEFLTAGIKFFEQASGRQKPVTDKERPRWLAELIASGPYLVVLDGLEALQKRSLATYTEKDEGDSELPAGEFRTRFAGMKRFLAAVNSYDGQGKLLLTSRQRLPDLPSGPPVGQIALHGLDHASAVRVLVRHGVVGLPQELSQVADYLGGHALSLTLFGFATAWRHEGLASAWRQTDLSEGRLSDGEADDRIVHSYVKWLNGTPQLQLLRLVGYFSKRHIPLSDLKTLLLCSELTTITAKLVDAVRANGEDAELNHERLYDILGLLQRNGLLLYSTPGDAAGEATAAVYDAHPLLRDYFRQELINLDGGRYWTVGHTALFKAYAGRVAGQAETATQVRTLYEAVGYACEAGLFREAFDLYWQRIHHNDTTYALPRWHGHRLGLYSEDLWALGWFFDQLWQKLHPQAADALEDDQEHLIRYAVAQCLLQLGYTSEAGHPINSARSYFENRANLLIYAANTAGWECERKLIQGEFADARQAGEAALELAKRSNKPRQILSKLGRLADLKMQTGDWTGAESTFGEILRLHGEELVKQNRPADTPIGGMTGFLYCEFLLTRAEIVLADWDTAGQYLGGNAPSRHQAIQNLTFVIENARHLLSIEDTPTSVLSQTDSVLHRFLLERARGIENILVTNPPRVDVQVSIDRHLAELQKDFDQSARSESPRLLVKRSKVLRRLWTLRHDPQTARVPLAEAYHCLAMAGDVAKFGKMTLYEIDVDIEMAKLLECEARYPGRDSDAKEEVIKRARECFARAKQRIEQFGYKKRLPELLAFALLLESKSA